MSDTTVAFWTRDVPCEEALPALVEAYNKRADELETAWAERDEARRERDLAQSHIDGALASERSSEFHNDRLETALSASEAEVDRLTELRERLLEAIGDAMLSLATGPLREGYAYSVLEEALVSVGETGE